MDPFVRLLSDIDKEKVDIVVSSSTVATLADCHYANQWDIPLNVQLDGQGRKVVLLDKPFIKYVPHEEATQFITPFWVLMLLVFFFWTPQNFTFSFCVHLELGRS